MAAAVPTSVPAELGAGRSATWQISLPSYLATDGYSLRYVLHNGTNKVTFTSEADGSAHLISISSTDSAAWEPGTYAYQAYAEKEGESWVVAQGTITVLPDFAAAATLDARSNAQKMLAEVEQACIDLAGKRISSYSTVSGTFTRANITELYNLRSQLRRELGISGGLKKIRSSIGPVVQPFPNYLR